MGNSLYTRLFGDCEVRVLMLGLDAAGKTTILYKLKLGEIVTTIPTIGFNVESIQHNDFSLFTWDVGLRDKMRPLVRHYYQNTDAIMFVIDSSDRERYDEAIEEFLSMTVGEDELSDAVYLIVANKQDLDNPMSATEIEDDIRKRNILSDKTWKVFEVCGHTGNGFPEALDWLTENLAHLRFRQGCLRGILPSYPAIKRTSNAEPQINTRNSDSVTKNKTVHSYYGAFLHSMKKMFTLSKE